MLSNGCIIKKFFYRHYNYVKKVNVLIYFHQNSFIREISSCEFTDHEMFLF
jgi:hypothetical protein